MESDGVASGCGFGVVRHGPGAGVAAVACCGPVEAPEGAAEFGVGAGGEGHGCDVGGHAGHGVRGGVPPGL